MGTVAEQPMERSDAPYPSPYYPIRESVMSLERQDSNTQSNTNIGVSPVYPPFNNHPNFYFQSAAAAAAAAAAATSPGNSSFPSNNSLQHNNRLRHTEQAIYDKILREAKKTGEKSDDSAANEKEALEEPANQTPGCSSPPMTNHSHLDERAAPPQHVASLHGDDLAQRQIDTPPGERQSRSADNSPQRSPLPEHPPSLPPSPTEPPERRRSCTPSPQMAPLEEDGSHVSDSGSGAAVSEISDQAAYNSMERAASGDENEEPRHDLSGQDSMHTESREGENRQQQGSPVGGATSTPLPVSPGSKGPAISFPGAVSPALTRGPVSPALAGEEVSPAAARGPPPLLIAPLYEGGEMTYAAGMMTTPTKNQDVVYRPRSDSNSSSSFTPGGGSLTPDGVGSLTPGGVGEADKSGELFYCHLCTYVGMSRHHFNVHMNSHFEHSCPHCDYSSRTEGRLKRHIKDFHGDNPPETFAGNKTMRRDMTGAGRPKVFKCRQCEYIAENKVDFWEHSRAHIKTDKILQCPKCPFVTEYKHHLEYHLRNHFGSKPFKCNKCNYACVNKSMLNSHMKSHTNVYQYRCADCTYATKYCHSLKLHLKKYNHQPATVLNLDGSLPTDGSGDFELVSKRGPPRGPRGPRKDMVPSSPSAGLPPSMLLPQHGLPGHSPITGAAMFGPGFWPMNGLHPPPPLIPVSGMSPLSIHLSQDPSSKASGSSGDAQHPQHPQQQQQQQQQQSQSSMSSFKCNLCPFGADSYETFSHHMLKVHAAENQDLLNVFGIQPEALTDRYNNMKAAAAAAAAVQRQQQELYNTPSKLQDMSQTWAALHHLSNSAASIAAGSLAPTLKASPESYRSMNREPFGSSSKPTNHQEVAPQPPPPQRPRGDCPLDLTKRRGADLVREFNMHHQAGESSEFRAMKRRYQAEEEDETMRERNNSPPSGTTSPTPPRKRSRKGKAYKLDTLCMKLQERYSGSPPPGYEDANDDEYSDDYSMGKDSDAPPGEESGPSSAEPHHGSSATGDGSEKDDGAAVDYSEIHSNLSALNNGLASADQRYRMEDEEEEEDVENHDSNRKVARRIQFGQQSDGRPSNGRLSEERSEESPLNAEENSGKVPAMNGSTYECQHCGIAFRDCIMYTMHMGYHGYQDPFKCNMCGQQSANKVEFFLHIARTAHE